MRLFIGVLVVAAALTVGGCASSKAALDSQPQDARSGRALAHTVADTANCPNFEEDGPVADHWNFTCQKPDQTFLIRVFSNATGLDDAIKKLRADGEPYKAGRFFVVHQATGENHVNTPEDLKEFPGEPGALLHEGSRS